MTSTGNFVVGPDDASVGYWDGAWVVARNFTTSAPWGVFVTNPIFNVITKDRPFDPVPSNEISAFHPLLKGGWEFGWVFGFPTVRDATMFRLTYL